MDDSFFEEKNWQPTATFANINARAKLLAAIRSFFSDRNVLEVETPLLAHYSVTDPHMQAITAQNPLGGSSPFYLQTSPEYAMKRLLAAGSGPIFQICKAFRKGEASRRHNPEFTLLEWYRPDFDDHQLMEEIEGLLRALNANWPAFEKVTYHSLFEQHLQINPHSIDVGSLQKVARQYIDVQMDSDNKDDWLNLLLAEVIEPTLGIKAPVFVIEYPSSQSALAQLSPNQQGVEIARRFELYIDSVELANGYFELNDVTEQRRRFNQDQQMREQLQRPTIASDQFLLAAMEHGLPSCSGVALGIDRLLMLLLKVHTIDDVIFFPVGRA